MIEEILNKIYTSNLLSSEELHELTEWVCNKDKEIERLNNIINEALEFIKENETTFNVHNVANAFGIPSLEFTLEPWKKELLDILKGVDKE